MIDATLFSHIPALNPELKAPKIEFEYQDVCLQIESFFGKNKVIWTLPWKKGVTESLLRYALKECQTRGKKDLKYFLAIVNNKIKNAPNFS